MHTPNQKNLYAKLVKSFMAIYIVLKVTTIARQGVRVGVLATAVDLGWRSE